MAFSLWTRRKKAQSGITGVGLGLEVSVESCLRENREAYLVEHIGGLSVGCITADPLAGSESGALERSRMGGRCRRVRAEGKRALQGSSLERGGQSSHPGGTHLEHPDICYLRGEASGTWREEAESGGGPKGTGSQPLMGLSAGPHCAKPPRGQTEWKMDTEASGLVSCLPPVVSQPFCTWPLVSS